MAAVFLFISSLCLGAGTPGRYNSPQPFDMVHYRLDLSLAMTDERFGGTCIMTLVLTAPADSVVLNELSLDLASVTVNDSAAGFAVEPAAETFTVHLGREHAAGDTLRIAVAYRRDPALARSGGRLGYYFFPATTDNPANLGYTMSEPSDARLWMPCYDQPSEKATAEINVTVPAGYVAASNGRLLGVSSDSGLTYHWREDHPLATYLMCVTASRFAVPSAPFIRAAGDTIPVQYYVWQPDSSKCAQYLPIVSHMIAAFGTRFGPYPFEKYAMSGVAPFGYGGMEHQTMTTLHRLYETNDNVVSHELAHQWWGDLVTCGTWADIWLNESFASYGEALWKEVQGGPAALVAYMTRAFLNFNASSWQYAVYDPAGQGQDLFAQLVYSKGAWVLHALRGVVGDSLFFSSLRAYRQKFAGRSAVTREFAAVVDSVVGRDMRWFFDEWVFSPGWPEYASRYSWAADTLRLTLYQTQRPPTGWTGAAWPTYKMPLRVRVAGGGNDTMIVVQDSLREQSFGIPLSFSPDSIVVDPDSWVLKKIVPPPVTGVEEDRRAVSYRLEQNYPNPFNPATTIRYALPSDSDVQLEVYDLLGREVAVLVRGNERAGEHQVRFDGRTLASGLYLYRLSAGGFALTRAMILVK